MKHMTYSAIMWHHFIKPLIKALIFIVFLFFVDYSLFQFEPEKWQIRSPHFWRWFSFAFVFIMGIVDRTYIELASIKWPNMSGIVKALIRLLIASTLIGFYCYILHYFPVLSQPLGIVISIGALLTVYCVIYVVNNERFKSERTKTS